MAAARNNLAALPDGPAWVLASPAQGQLARIRSPAYRQAVESFLELGVKRVMEPADQDFWSIMRETTFHNEASGSILPTALQSQRARTWLRLSDVRHASASALAPDEQMDLATILEALPAPWATAATSATEPPPTWVAVATHTAAGEAGPPGPRVVVCGPWPNPGPPEPLGFTGQYDLLPTGRLAARIGLPPVLGPGRPALVILRAKPRVALRREDFDYMAQQATLPAATRLAPVEPYLVGEWATLAVDPRVWGLPGASDLLGLSVREARRALLNRRAGVEPGVVDSGAVYPPAWSKLAPDGAAVGGLAVAEQSWRDTAASVAAAAEAQEAGTDGMAVDWVPPWLPIRSAGAPRPDAAARALRAASRAATQAHPTQPAAPTPAPASPPAARGGSKRCWGRLLDPTIHRPFVITAWRALHCCLGVPAFIHHVTKRGSPLCPLPCCAPPPSGGARPQDDITHSLLQCPASQPVISWLADTWQALTGLSAPTTAAFIIADIPSEGWPGCGEDKWLLEQWTRLRVATIGAIWRVRSLAAEGGCEPACMPRTAARMAAESVRAAIARDWARAKLDVRALDTAAFPPHWWGGTGVTLSQSRFEDRWARPGRPAVFCTVHAAPGGPADATIAVHIGVGDPVPLPSAP